MQSLIPSGGKTLSNKLNGRSKTGKLEGFIGDEYKIKSPAVVGSNLLRSGNPMDVLKPGARSVR